MRFIHETEPCGSWWMLVLLSPKSLGVSSPELVPPELDNVMSDPLDVRQSALNSALRVMALAETSYDTEKEEFQ